MPLDTGTVTVPELRSLTHCLNAQGQVDALEKFLSQVSDSNLQPIANAINVLVAEQPQYLYALKIAYQNAEQNGNLAVLEQTLASLLSSSAKNAALVKIVQKLSDPLVNTLLNPSLSISEDGIFTILSSNAYQRLGQEVLQTDGLKRLLSACLHYINAKDSKPIQALYHYVSDNSLDTSWTNLMSQSEQYHVQNIAHFFEWLATDDHYGILSRSIRDESKNPISCFNGAKTIPNIMTAVMPEITALDANQVKHFFTHDHKNLYLFGHGYCEFPFQATDVIKLVGEATEVKGFDEVFTLAKPLFNHPDFIAFMGSEAAERFISEIGPLAKTHFFEDLFTLATLHLKSPLSNHGDEIASLLDQVFKPLNDSDVQTLVDFFSPILNAQAGYGAQASQALDQISLGFPDITPHLSSDIRGALRTALKHVLVTPSLSPVLDLADQLIGLGKLNGILDQAINYLARLFEKGKMTASSMSIAIQADAIPSHTYVLNKITDTKVPADPCGDINYEWVFTQYSSQNSSAYLQYLNAIQNCVDPTQTFASFKDFIEYSISQGNYNFVLKEQAGALNTLFAIDSDLAFTSMDDFLKITQNDSNSLKALVGIGSSSLKAVKDSYLKKNDLRAYLATLLADPTVYQVAGELTDKIPERTRSSLPTIDLPNLATVDAFVTRKQTLKGVPVEDAVKAIMLHYCPSLDPQDADCDVDEDQVTLYQQSPKLLFQQIAHEELDSPQSWLHPKMSPNWIHETRHPQEVSEFEFHLNPTLHLNKNAPQAPQAIINTLTRLNTDHINLSKFLSERATRVILIPYIIAVPEFPSKNKREYHDRIRLRLLNDLDRLELISINADFKALGLVSNFGLGLLREVALSWGDEKPENRPQSLSKYIDPSTSKTLLQVKEYIDAEMSKYDKSAIQVLGNCDPRGRGFLGRFFANQICNAEFADISARLFNLRFLISLLQDELPPQNGGKGGLFFLRDLFYSLYDANSNSQRNQFSNGVLFPKECFNNPVSASDADPKCQSDLLGFVPRIAHLGLLHEASIAILQAQDHPVNAIASLLQRAVLRTDLTTRFVSTFSQDAGLQMVTDSVEFGFQAPLGTGKNLGLLAQLISIPADLNWSNLAFDLALQDPHFPSQNEALMNSLLETDATSFVPRLDHWLLDQKLPVPRLLELLSQKLTPAARNDIVNLLIDLTPQSQTLANDITAAKNVPELETPLLKQDAHLWAGKFANPAHAHVRQDLSQWTLHSDFDEFCGVFSDSTFTTKAYNFLESVKHNPDARAFFDSCQNLLNAKEAPLASH